MPQTTIPTTGAAGAIEAAAKNPFHLRNDSDTCIFVKLSLLSFICWWFPTSITKFLIPYQPQYSLAQGGRNRGLPCFPCRCQPLVIRLPTASRISYTTPFNSFSPPDTQLPAPTHLLLFLLCLLLSNCWRLLSLATVTKGCKAKRKRQPMLRLYR